MTPQKNEVAEWMNRILLEKSQYMLLNADLEREFQADVANMTCYLVNQSSNIIIECQTRKKVWFDKLVDYLNLQIFDCHVYIHVNKGKLKLKLNKCIFLSYATKVKGYKFQYSDLKSPKFLIKILYFTRRRSPLLFLMQVELKMLITKQS